MHCDARGLALTTGSGPAARLYDETVDAYFAYRLAAGKGAKATLAADPDFVMGHVLMGYLFMLFGSTAMFPRVAGALAAAKAGAPGVTAREQLHVDALEAWLAGDLLRSCAVWERILVDHPHDLLALRLHHFNSFWMGRNSMLRSAAASVLDAWDESLPGYANVLGMLSFGLEECGEYAPAEAHGRRAVEMDPDDLWAVHAVAHVLEMQGRLDDGIAWLDYPADAFDDRNPFRGHLWWHLALYSHEKGEYDRVLALYDRSIRPERTEFYLDIQNMASLLLRLEFQGVDVGDRWEDLADHAETRIDDHVLAFTDVHAMMALGAAGRAGAGQRLIASLREYASRPDDFAAATMEPVTVPLCEAIADYHAGDFESAVERLLAVRHALAPVGGSHAQRDVFWQLLLEAAIRGGRLALARSLLSERVHLRPHSFGNWRKYVRVLDDLGEAGAAARARDGARDAGFERAAA